MRTGNLFDSCSILAVSTVSQAQLDTVARKLNTRPRETLNWKMPAYILECFDDRLRPSYPCVRKKMGTMSPVRTKPLHC